MKLNWNRKYTTISLYVFLTAVSIILFLMAFIYHKSIFATLSDLISILRPVLYGVIAAYLLIPLDDSIMSMFKKLFPQGYEKEKVHLFFRTISILFSYIIFLGLFSGFVLIVIPDVVVSVNNISGNLSAYFQKAIGYLDRLNVPYIEVIKKLINTTDVFNNAYSVAEKVLPTLYIFFQGFFAEIVNFVIGLLLSLYIIIGRKKAKFMGKKALQAFMEDFNADKVSNYCKHVSRTFGSFISGIVIDSTIVGVVCYILLLIMDIPNPALISVWVGLTNIIPIFGPFVGAIPSAAVILLTAPEKTWLFILFIFVLQQMDGYVIKPKILGDSMGMPAFWVVVSLLVFGGFFGIFGLLVAVPVSALIYDALKNYAKRCLKEKNAVNAAKAEKAKTSGN